MSTTVKKEVISWVKTILLAAVLAGLVNSFLIVNAEVPTGSMENTIMAGDRILALRTSYWFDEPEAGDIVVFRYPDDETGKTLYVKRIIGTPGDTVEMSNGTVYVNGKALQEDYDRIEHRRHLNEISLEEELAGLEEIRRKHRMTAKEIMSWEEKVYDLKKEIRERDADSIDQLADGVVSALEKRYEAMRDAEIERLDKSRKAWEQWRDDSVQAIEDQIAALERLSDSEDEEKKSAEELRKIEKLRREAEYEQDEYNRKKLQQQLDEAISSREERLRKLELKQQKEALQEEIEKIRDQASEKIKELDGEQAAIEKAYEERLKAASLQAEAEKLLMTKSQDELMSLLYEYVPEYDALGKSMGEKLLEGFQSKAGSIADWFRSFNDQLARMQENLAGSMNVATDRFYQERQAQGQSAGATVNQTVNFYEPVESPGQVARRMEDVNDQLGMMMA